MHYASYKTVTVNGHRYRTTDDPQTRYQRHPYYPWLFVDTWGTLKALTWVNGKHGMGRRITKRFNAAHKASARKANLAARAETNSAFASGRSRNPVWSGCRGPAAPYRPGHLPKALPRAA